MRSVLLGLARIALGLLFLWAAVSKLGDMVGFAEEVANYQILPPAAVPLVAAALPGVEIAAGAVLLLGVATRAAALVLSSLLLGFIAGLSQALLRGVDLRCGCFGGSDLATWSTVARDAVMLATAAAVGLLGPGRWAVAARAAGGRPGTASRFP